MESALRERLASGKHTNNVPQNPRSPGTFMMRQQTSVREHFSLRQYASIQIDALHSKVLEKENDALDQAVDAVLVWR